MKPGRVVTIRVSPDDCMSCIDAADMLGIPTANMSFSQLIRTVFRSLMEDQRTKGTIPRRTGFEYERIMSQFPAVNRSRRAALRVTEAAGHPDAYTPPMQPEEPERRSRRLRYEELAIRRESDPLNFTVEDQIEFAPLVLEFFA